MDLSGRMMPIELKVPPAATVMSLVNVASAVAPFSPLIVSSLDLNLRLQTKRGFSRFFGP
jgi:hypothetical protein